MASGDPDRWWHGGVFYQVYPRSFADSDGDGVGDIRGIVTKLDYLARLGVDGVWLSPVTPSPNRDWGYDVSDYRQVDPSLGTLEDLDTLVRLAGARGIRILLDLVPNHTSDQHPWFVDARSGRGAAHRDYYVWADPKPDGSPPNNWMSVFGGSAWKLDEPSGQYYLHNFEAEQPDLNWWSDDVRREFDEIVRYWWDRGIAGFRIDVCNMMIKDAELRDNPPASEDDTLAEQVMGVRSVYNSDRPEAHEILKRWRALARTYEPERLLIGETNVPTVEHMVEYYGDGHDELHGGFNFVFIEAPFEADALRPVVERTEALLPDGAWPVWTGSNHDVSRLATRWAGGDPARAKVALLMLCTLRGTPFLYQGDEIGLVDGPIEREDVRDAVGIRFWPYYKGRDPERTPMPWHGSPGAGFTEPGVRPWLPMADPAACNVADQEGDPTSVLELCRRAIAARRASEDLAVGSYRSLASPPGTWAWARGAGTTVLLNMAEDPVTFEAVSGTVRVGTDPALEGTPVDGTLTLPGWSGAVVAPAEGTVMAPAEDTAFERSGLIEDLPARQLHRGLFHLLFGREPAPDDVLGAQLEQGSLRPRQALEWLVDSAEWASAAPMTEFGPSLHFGRGIFVRSLPRARRILDIGGVAVGVPYGALVLMGYPYRFDELVIVDLPSEDRHELYRTDEQPRSVETPGGRVTYRYHSMTDLSSYPSGSFDMVYSGESIEHIKRREAEHVFAEVHRVLRPGGVFALDTPNATMTRLQQAVYIDPDHEYEYTHAEMSAMLRGHGFVIEQAVGINYGGDSLARGVFDPGELATKRGPFAEIDACYLLAYVCRRPHRPTARTLSERAAWKVTSPDGLPRRGLRFARRAWRGGSRDTP